MTYLTKMEYCLVAFCTDKKDWISSLIRFVTWDKFSHVALVSSDMLYVVESTHGIGVRKIPFKMFHSRYRDGIELRLIPHPHPEQVWARAESQLGKPYDNSFIYGWLFRRTNWQDPEKWACAEVLAWAGEWFKDVAELRSSISPRDLHLISKPFKEI